MASQAVAEGARSADAGAATAVPVISSDAATQARSRAKTGEVLPSAATGVGTAEPTKPTAMVAARRAAELSDKAAPVAAKEAQVLVRPAIPLYHLHASWTCCHGP